MARTTNTSRVPPPYLQAPPYHKWGDALTPEETTNVYNQVRSTLMENRVVFATSGKAIHSCLHVLKTTPDSINSAKQRRSKRIGSTDDDDDDDGVDPGTAVVVAAASEFSPVQCEARDFANECAARAIGILLEQSTSRVELRYQDIISQTLLESVELSSCLLARADTRSAGVDILLYVLDSTKRYYAGTVLFLADLFHLHLPGLILFSFKSKTSFQICRQQFCGWSSQLLRSGTCQCLEARVGELSPFRLSDRNISNVCRVHHGRK